MSFLSVFEIIFWLLRLPDKKDKQYQPHKSTDEVQSIEAGMTEPSSPFDYIPPTTIKIYPSK